MNCIKIGNQIEQMLTKLGDATTTKDGIWRAIYTKEDFIGKRIVKEYMNDAGLDVSEDELGNLIGTWPVSNGEGNRMIIGSHIDTVKNGGKYDGAAGIITAITAIKLLKNEGFTPSISIQIIALEEEEGSRFPLAYIGSRSILGKIKEEELDYPDNDGISLKEAMVAAGYSPQSILHDEPTDIKEYVELHVEQGIYLDREGIDIGVVDNIVGLHIFEITVYGEQNHAGTTPMKMRKDPVMAVSAWMTKIREQLLSMSDTVTFTVGDITVKPGLSNVIPHHIHFTVDLRDGDKTLLERESALVKSSLEDLTNSGFTVEIKTPCHEYPEQCDDEMKDAIASAAKKLGYSYKIMNSGAGHDAQVFASCVPTAMIFVPSTGGISHSPLEYTEPQFLGKGCLTLMEYIKGRFTE